MNQNQEPKNSTADLPGRRLRPIVVFLREDGTLRHAPTVRTYDESAEVCMSIFNTADNRARVRALLADMERDADETAEAAMLLLAQAHGYEKQEVFYSPDDSQTATARRGVEFLTITSTVLDSEEVEE